MPIRLSFSQRVMCMGKLPCRICKKDTLVPSGLYDMLKHRHGDKAGVICCNKKEEIIATGYDPIRKKRKTKWSCYEA